MVCVLCTCIHTHTSVDYEEQPFMLIDLQQKVGADAAAAPIRTI